MDCVGRKYVEGPYKKSQNHSLMKETLTLIANNVVTVSLRTERFHNVGG